MRAFARRATVFLSSPWAVVIFILWSGLWLASGVAVEALLSVLSILAITMTQLILLSGDTDTRAIQAKLDELILSTDKADNAKVAMEKQAD